MKRININQLIHRMKQIGHQVITRMLHDHLKCELLADKAIPGFDLNTVTFEVIGPVFDNDFGICYMFQLQINPLFDYIPTNWNN